MLIDGLKSVVWIIMFLSAVLDSHSDGTHSLAEESLVSKWCNAAFLQICSVCFSNTLNYILGGLLIFILKGPEISS